MHTLNPWDNKHIVRSSGLTKPSGLCLRGPDEMHKSHPTSPSYPQRKRWGRPSPTKEGAFWNHDIGLGHLSLEELR